MEYKVVNLTPHEINFVRKETGEVYLTIPPSGTVARCKEKTVELQSIIVEGKVVKISQTTFSTVKGLPEPSGDTIFVVSRIVMTALGDSRPDVFSVGETVREGKTIIGTYGLSV